MKSIANQYRDLKEGKMSQSNFMRNLRMSMPQYITNVTSFNDAVKILKNKAILTEADINELSPQTKYNAAMKAVNKLNAAGGTSDSKYTKALRQGNKFAQEIDPVLKNAVEDFGKSLGFNTRIEKSTTGAQYEPIIQIRMGRDPREPQIKVVITKDTDKIEGRVNLPDEAAERKLGNLIKQIQQKELDVELKESDPDRNAELGGVEEDFKQLLAKGYSYYEALELIAQNTGMDPDELESMLPQDAVDTEEYEEDELDAIISRMGGEEEAEKAIKGGFGIYDPLEEANGEFPRGAEEMAQAIADEFGNELISLSGREKEKMALSHAYEKILNSGHPKAKIIARNLVFGYADEDWPMDYISTLNDILSKKEDDELSAISSKMDDEPKVPEMPMFKGTRDALDDLSIREEEINEYEHTYRKIDGVCYKIDDEGNRTRVNDRYCRYNEDLNEGRKKKEPKKELHPNQIHPGELRMGIKVELEHTDDLDKAKKIALDHLAENPYYYTALKLSGIESPSAPKVKTPAEKKAKKKKEAVELVDKANAMQKVKMPKIVKEVRINAMPGEETNATMKHAMQYIDSDIANPTLKALSNELELQPLRGNRAILRYGYWEKMPDEALAAVKKQFDVEEDIETEDDKADSYIYIISSKKKPGGLGSSLDMGGSKASKMDTFREALEKLVRETIAETFDGRDNLANITDDTK